MGLLKTHWEATYEGCLITIRRNEWTKGFIVECDGERVAKRTWTLVGLGTVKGELTFEDRAIPFEVEVQPRSECFLRIEGEEIRASLVE